MKNQKWLNTLMLVAGMVLGPFALVYLREEFLTLGWWNVIYTFFLCLIGSLFIVGINIAWEKPGYGSFLYASSALVSHSVLGIGISSLLTSILIGSVNPAAMLFIAAGIGLFIGVVVSGAFLTARFQRTS